MKYVKFGGIRDPLKQNLALQFCRNQNKDVIVLTETHINLDQIQHIRNNWLGAMFYSQGVSHTKGLLVLLHLGLEGVTEVDTDPKRKFVSFKVTPSIYRFLCVYTPSGYSTRKQLARGRFFEVIQNYIENKNEGNENKMILGDFNCAMYKIERDGWNKTLYRYCFSYALSKLTMDNRLEDLWKKKNPDSSGFTSYDRSSGTRSGIDGVYTDIKIANNTNINHIMVSFTDDYNAIFIDTFSSKIKIIKHSWYFNNSLLCKPEFFLTTKIFRFLLKTQNTSTFQQVADGKTLYLVLKKILELFLKIQEIIIIPILKRRLQNLYKKGNYKPEI